MARALRGPRCCAAKLEVRVGDATPVILPEAAYGRASGLITLTFLPAHGEAIVLVRGVFFRICADGTLRAPDNSPVAAYADGLWQLGHRHHRAVECAGPVYLRATTLSGRRECTGPYEILRAVGGAIFSRDTCLGLHAGRVEPDLSAIRLWREIAILSAL